MKYLDLLYFVSYHGYVRGNKERMGAFMINSLWISVFQFFLVFSSLIFIEVYTKHRFLDFMYNFVNFIMVLGAFVLTNNTYLMICDRQAKILQRFEFSEKKIKIYWYILISLFFISYFVFAFASHLRKDTFGW